MKYTPPHSDEAKKVTFLYFMTLLVAIMAIYTIGFFNNRASVNTVAEEIKRAISDQRFDKAKDVLEVYSNHTSTQDEDYSELTKNFDIEAHTHSVLTNYNLGAFEQLDAYKLLYRITKKDAYKEQIKLLTPIAEDTNKN
jgi:hypothetical protein